MSSLMASAWFVVALPFALAVIIPLLGSGGRWLAPVLSAGSAIAVLTFALIALGRSGDLSSASPWTSGFVAEKSVGWIGSGASVLTLGMAVDSLTALMLTVVGFVALMVTVFSVGYLAGDSGWNRYFALLSLFTGSMTVLVVADSFVTLFIGWELVGASSYLLIGFWYRKPEANAAAVKAFLTTRVGDVAFLLGLAVLWSGLGTLSFTEISAQIGSMSPLLAGAAAVLIALGAMGKSAQFPFHGWLPDAMEGPTPVSALIHAATMVAAGVFLVVRVWPLFEAAPVAKSVLLVAGTVSALGAALIAVAQRDIKKVLAYSTVSQLGFMFAALGVGAWYVAFFHLVTHAAFKGLLFLSAGSVIHGSGTQDLHGMGGLRRSMPMTFVAWTAGALALVGIPGFSGFFSKDAVLERVWHVSPFAGAALFVAAGLTALYMARATRLAFFGSSRAEKPAHESPLVMLAPLLGMTVPAVVVGWFGSGLFNTLGVEPEPLAIAIASTATFAALAGMGIGWLVGESDVSDDRALKRLGAWGRAMGAGFYWDRAVSRFVVTPVVMSGRISWAFVDRFVIDGIVEGAGSLARSASRWFSGLQTGNAQSYSRALALGVLLMLFVTVWLGR